MNVKTLRLKIRVLSLLELNSTKRNVTNKCGLTLRNDDVRAFKTSDLWHLESPIFFGGIFSFDITPVR